MSGGDGLRPEAPLRVVHVMPQIGVGGAELQLLQLVRLASRSRVLQRVLYYSDCFDTVALSQYQDAGVDLKRVTRRRRSPLRFLDDLAATIAMSDPHIVHCWLESGALWGRWAARRLHPRVVLLSFRSSRIGLRPFLLMSRWVDGPNVHYCANSRAVAASVKRVLHVPDERIVIVPNGVDWRAYDEAREPGALATLCSCPPQTRTVLSVGRLDTPKNYPMLIRLAARCRGTLPVHFFIAGHGPLEAELHERARAEGVSDIVHFLGLRTDVAALLRGADVFCFTSTWEGFPNALLEAMMAGVPIITTDFDGVTDLVTPGVEALVVPRDDVAEAFRALREVLSRGAWAVSLGDRARARARSDYSASNMVERMTELYERLAGASDEESVVGRSGTAGGPVAP